VGPAMLFSAAPTDSSSHSSCELGQAGDWCDLIFSARLGKETERRRHLTLTLTDSDNTVNCSLTHMETIIHRSVFIGTTA